MLILHIHIIIISYHCITWCKCILISTGVWCQTQCSQASGTASASASAPASASPKSSWHSQSSGLAQKDWSCWPEEPLRHGSERQDWHAQVQRQILKSEHVKVWRCDDWCHAYVMPMIDNKCFAKNVFFLQNLSTRCWITLYFYTEKRPISNKGSSLNLTL